MSKELKEMKILVVEDQPQPMHLLTMILKDLHVANIYTANDGKAAQQLLSEMDGHIDLIICDWNMPRMSGIELLRRVRAAYPDVPFVMVTANADAGSIKEAKKHGVNMYITKPYAPDEIEGKLNAIAAQI